MVTLKDLAKELGVIANFKKLLASDTGPAHHMNDN